MKKHFITGLIILAPLALTLAILTFIFNLLTEPLAGVVSTLFDRYNFLSGKQLQTLVSQVLILVLLFFLTVSLGAIARYFFFSYLLAVWDYILHKIPVISTIYKTSQEFIQTLFGGSANSFKQVVMVPFPSPETRSVGFITRDNVEGLVPGKKMVAVFVPTAPNPTSGFLMLYNPEDITHLDMKVEEAFKYILSCGVLLNNEK